MHKRNPYLKIFLKKQNILKKSTICELCEKLANTDLAEIISSCNTMVFVHVNSCVFIGQLSHDAMVCCHFGSICRQDAEGE